jgi:hypothetical protein
MAGMILGGVAGALLFGIGFGLWHWAPAIAEYLARVYRPYQRGILAREARWNAEPGGNRALLRLIGLAFMATGIYSLILGVTGQLRWHP